MYPNSRYGSNLYAQQTSNVERYPNPDKISVPYGYKIEVFAQGLNSPIAIAFKENGDMLIADSGLATGDAKVLLLSKGQFTTVADGFRVPITGINYKSGDLYVSHKAAITVIKSNGERTDIIKGLPSFGDFGNNRVEIGLDGKIYYGQGTMTNSGIVGLDNAWVLDRPFIHDNAGSHVLLREVNYETQNLRTPAGNPALTGAFSPFGIPVQEHEVAKGVLYASGSIMRANLDGSNLEMLAWGLRNPFMVKFDKANRLYISNQGLDNRGSRPIANASDELFILKQGGWYGWPDYNAGELVNQSRFSALGGTPPELLLESIPSIPINPVTTFPAGSTIMGFDFNYNKEFDDIGNLYIAKFGKVIYEEKDESLRSGVGHRITKVDVATGELTTFAINKSGFPEEEGLGRPTDVVFGPDGAMYISDLAIATFEVPNVYYPNTGVIWKISKIV